MRFTSSMVSLELQAYTAWVFSAPIIAQPLSLIISGVRQSLDYLSCIPFFTRKAKNGIHEETKYHAAAGYNRFCVLTLFDIAGECSGIIAQAWGRGLCRQ